MFEPVHRQAALSLPPGSLRRRTAAPNKGKMTLTSFGRNAILDPYEIQRENSVFFAGQHSFCLPAEKQNQGRWMGPREAVTARSRRGMQKLSGKRIGSGRHFGKCGAAAHQRGNRAPRFVRHPGISQVGTEAKGPAGSFCLFLFSRHTPLPVRRGARAVDIDPYPITLSL